MIPEHIKKILDLAVCMGDLNNTPDFKLFIDSLKKQGAYLLKVKNDKVYIVAEPNSTFVMDEYTRECAKYILRKHWDYGLMWKLTKLEG